MDNDPSAASIAVLIAFYCSSLYFSIVKIIFSSTQRGSPPSGDDRMRYYAGKIEALDKKWNDVTASVSFGKTASNIGFSMLVLHVVTAGYPGLPFYQSALIAFGFSLVFLTIFAHTIPRALALRFYRFFLPFSYTLFSFLSWLFMPFVAVLNGAHGLLLKLLKYDEKFAFLSEEEKQRMSETGSDQEGLDQEEKEMIHSIFELGETKVEEIMVPRIDVIGLDVAADLQSTLKLIREEGHSRIPVYQETIDSIVGILYAKDLLNWLSENEPEAWRLSALIKKAHYVPTSKKIDDLMAEFKKGHIHIAVVVDEYGGTAGLVTMEDIIEEIVGEIQDEYDVEERPLVQVAENTYHADAHIDLHDLNEELHLNLEVDDVDYNTLGGLIYHEHGAVPIENSVLDHNGVQFKVLKMDQQRIEKVEIRIKDTANTARAE